LISKSSKCDIHISLKHKSPKKIIKRLLVAKDLHCRFCFKNKSSKFPQVNLNPGEAQLVWINGIQAKNMVYRTWSLKSSLNNKSIRNAHCMGSQQRLFPSGVGGNLNLRAPTVAVPGSSPLRARHVRFSSL
jgi:hypothetical protein